MAQVKKLDDGKYLIRVSKGTGKARTYINRTFRGTLKKAREHARDLETIVDSGFTAESVLTFREYMQLWLKAIKPKVSPRTYDGYQGYLKRYAETPLGDRRLHEIKPPHVQSIYVDLGQSKSPTTIRNLHAALNACFGYAVRHEYIRRNPCRNADLPQKHRKEIVVMTPPEAKRFVEISRTMQNGLIFWFALETGMRPEEYLALRWKDLNGDQLSVAQVIQFNRTGGGWYFAKPKTSKSRRTVMISESIRREIVVHRRQQNEHRLAMKGTWFNHDLIFPNDLGSPMAINNLTRRYLAPILAECDFGKHITLYALRHTCATLMLMNGENPKTVADKLGHSSVVMTLDTYSHILPNTHAAATNALDRLLTGS